MAAIKKSRGCYTGAVTKASDKLKLIQSDETAAIAAISATDIRRHLCSLERTEKNFLLTMDEAQEFVPEPEEEEGTFQAEEADILENFEEAVSAAKELATHLLAMKRVQTGLVDLTFDITSLEASLASRPDSDHSNRYTTIDSFFSELRQEWRKANLPKAHPLKGELDACTMRIDALAADIASAKHRAVPLPASASAHPGTPFKSDRNYTKLPAIALPTFTGDVLKWPTFWHKFSASVDANGDLPESTKLSYLRSAIKDPEADIILNPSIDGPDTYKRLVKELHQRYERTKKIHRELVEKLIHLPAAKNNSTDLRKLVDSTVNCVDCLNTTGHFTLEAFISSLVYSKLPYRLQIDWDDDQPDDNKVQPYPKLLEYVTKKAFTLSDHKSSAPTTPTTVPEKKPAQKQDKPSYSKPQKSHVYSVSAPTPSPNSYRWDCVLCKPERHPLHICPKWLGFSVDQRLTQVKDRNLCANCLAIGHATSVCNSSYRCRDCGQAHHTTIHKNSTPSVQVSSTLSQSQQLPDALLMTAEVLLKGPRGHQLKARAFLDPGAGLSLISSRVAQILDLPLESSRTSFTTVQGTKCQGSKYLTTVTISPLHNKQDFHCRPAVVQTVTEKIPNKLLAPVHDFPRLLGLQLADPTFNIPGRVDILLGTDLWLQIQGTSPPITSTPSEPGAQDTVFGWVLAGPVRAQGSSLQDIPACHIQPAMSDETLHNLAHDYWKAEAAERPELRPTLTDAQAEQLYHNTVSLTPTDWLPLGESRQQTVQNHPVYSVVKQSNTSISRRNSPAEQHIQNPTFQPDHQLEPSLQPLRTEDLTVPNVVACPFTECSAEPNSPKTLSASTPDNNIQKPICITHAIKLPTLPTDLLTGGFTTPPKHPASQAGYLL